MSGSRRDTAVPRRRPRTGEQKWVKEAGEALKHSTSYHTLTCLASTCPVLPTCFVAHLSLCFLPPSLLIPHPSAPPSYHAGLILSLSHPLTSFLTPSSSTSPILSSYPNPSHLPSPSTPLFFDSVLIPSKPDVLLIPSPFPLTHSIPYHTFTYPCISSHRASPPSSLQHTLPAKNSVGIGMTY